MPQDPAPLESTHAIADFSVVATLARGQRATVQLARSSSDALPRHVVIKSAVDASFCDASSRAALQAEARVLQMVDSPHVVRLLATGSEPQPFLIIEYVEGLSLRKIIELTAATGCARYVVPIIVDVLRGLSALHGLRDGHGRESPIVHQAPSPRHIIVGLDGRARLIDLSHAGGPALADRALHDPRLYPSEMAPEQIIAPGHVDARCDVFIAGVSLWEALTGQPLFSETSGEKAVHQLLRAPLAAPSEVASACPTHFDRLLERALQRAPWKRFSSAEEMADALSATARRHDLYAPEDERAAWLRTLIASTPTGRTPPSAVGKRAGRGLVASAFELPRGKDRLRIEMPDEPSSGPVPPQEISAQEVDFDDSPSAHEELVQRTTEIAAMETRCAVHRLVPRAVTGASPEPLARPRAPRIGRALGAAVGSALLLVVGAAALRELIARPEAPGPAVQAPRRVAAQRVSRAASHVVMPDVALPTRAAQSDEQPAPPVYGPPARASLPGVAARTSLQQASQAQPHQSATGPGAAKLPLSRPGQAKPQLNKAGQAKLPLKAPGQARPPLKAPGQARLTQATQATPTRATQMLNRPLQAPPLVNEPAQAKPWLNPPTAPASGVRSATKPAGPATVLPAAPASMPAAAAPAPRTADTGATTVPRLPSTLSTNPYPM